MKSAPVPLLLSLVLVPCGILGGFLYFRAQQAGIQVQWQMLPRPPTTQFTLTASGGGWLFITTSSGEVLQCCWDDPASWRPSTVPPDINDGSTIIHPCTQSGPEHLSWSKPPADQADCIEDAGYGGRHVYAVDDQRRLWAWRNDLGPGDSIAWCINGQLCGIALALLAAAAASPLFIKTRFFDNPPPSPPAA